MFSCKMLLYSPCQVGYVTECNGSSIALSDTDGDGDGEGDDSIDIASVSFG